MPDRRRVVFAFVVGCEIAFWLLLLAGLAARYPLRRRRLGAVLLALTPVTDVDADTVHSNG